MNPQLGRRALTTILATAVALGSALSLHPTPAVGAPTPGATAPGATAPVTSRAGVTPGVSLPRPAQGRRALRLLGDQLPAAARANAMAAHELRDLLRTDETAAVDRSGRLLFVDPAPETAVDTTTQQAVAAASAPLAETFALHSKPGSRRTIYLDFDGTDVSGTQWNSDFGVASGHHEGWDPRGNGPAFDDVERARVQSIWARVAEDFAPFDVDVTTEDPGTAAITRSGESDQVFGTRVLFSASGQAAAALCGSACGGVAYLDVFDWPHQHPTYQPAWVLTGPLGSDTKSLAEAASHEAGHNLALDHDGTSTSGYYAGHGSWAPIMGVGYQRPITQWSRGGYPGATNAQDDLAVIASSGAPLRADEAGHTVSTAAATLPVGPAHITADADQDVYALGTCRGEVSVAASPAAVSPNLDVSVTLLDRSGAVRARKNPLSAMVSRDAASGLAAAVTATVTSADYFVLVEGVGNGTALTGYDGYGSVGAYTLEVSGCGGADPSQDLATQEAASPVATRPGRVATPGAKPGATGGRATARVAWRRPQHDGGAAIAAYQVFAYRVAGGEVVQRVRLKKVTSRSLTFRASRGTRWRFAVRARNSEGWGRLSPRSRAVRVR